MITRNSGKFKALFVLPSSSYSLPTPHSSPRFDLFSMLDRNLIDLVEPGLFGSWKQFESEFANPIKISRYALHILSFSISTEAGKLSVD